MQNKFDKTQKRLHFGGEKKTILRLEIGLKCRERIEYLHIGQCRIFLGFKL